MLYVIVDRLIDQSCMHYFSHQELEFKLPMTSRMLNRFLMFARDEFLKGHIQFLENQGIAGVSHHSLLFSKSAPPVQVLSEEEEVLR